MKKSRGGKRENSTRFHISCGFKHGGAFFKASSERTSLIFQLGNVSGFSSMLALPGEIFLIENVKVLSLPPLPYLHEERSLARSSGVGGQTHPVHNPGTAVPDWSPAANPSEQAAGGGKTKQHKHDQVGKIISEGIKQ